MKKIILYIIVSLSVTVTFGQVPSTWQVNPSAYSNSMIITVVLNMNSQESRNQEDIVAAYLNNEVRGVAAPITFVKSKDRYMASLIVYSNDTNGLITFKLYNKDRNVVLDAVTLPITFVGESKLGSYDEPIVIKDNNIPTDITLSTAAVSENKPTGSLVGSIAVADNDVSDLHTISFLDGTGFDNAFFEIINGSLYTKAIFDFEKKSTYTIRIRAQDARNGIVDKAFTIHINDENEIEEVLAFNNIITPNNDGHNDYLVINNIDLYTSHDLYVFNIIGQLVFNSVNYSNNWSGSELKSGVYYLHFSGKDKEGKQFVYKEAFRIINN
jgi:gliding motility-associated-like protein